jgi:hypothetical protein
MLLDVATLVEKIQNISHPRIMPELSSNPHRAVLSSLVTAVQCLCLGNVLTRKKLCQRVERDSTVVRRMSKATCSWLAVCRVWRGREDFPGCQPCRRKILISHDMPIGNILKAL